jgi:hypothetical protein
VSDLALDETGDLQLTAVGGSETALELVRDAAYVRQSLAIRLKHFRGEWFRDVNAGTDWYDQILGKATDLSRRAELRRRLLGTPGVVALPRLSLQLDGVRRSLTVDFEVQLESGESLADQFEVAT